MRYTPRRLRKRVVRVPEWMIKVDHPITAEDAARIKEQWMHAGRAGVAVVGPGVEIRRL